MPLTRSARARKSPVEAHAECRRLDLPRIARRHRRDAIGELQGRLKKTDRAVIFNAVDAEGLRRQSQRLQQLFGILALEGDVVNREDGRGAWAIRVMHIGWRERRLPVMGMDDVWREIVQRAEADLRAGPGERAEAEGVVRIVGPIRPRIKSAFARIEMRRDEGVNFDVAEARRMNPRGTAEEIVESKDRFADA